jgi:hypothetical protein
MKKNNSLINIAIKKAYIFLTNNVHLTFFAIFSILYCIFVYKSYSNIFFEAQFAHIPFIEDLTKNSFNIANFATTFGEHIVIGYNIILFFSYHLTKLSGAFDPILSTVSVILIAWLIYKVIKRDNLLAKSVWLSAVSLVLLSATNNSTSAMSLSALFGVMLFVFSLYLLHVKNYQGSFWARLPPYILLFFSMAFFLGGYAVGAIASLFILSLWIYVNKSKRAGLHLFSATAISLLAYLSIILIYGNLFWNKPTLGSFELGKFFDFLIKMLGASVLGKTYIESSNNIIFYYLIGLVLFIWSLFFLCTSYTKNNKKWFIHTLFLYSFFNIVFVSLFRYKTGDPLGQWYMAHTHFIPIMIFICLVHYLESKNKFLKVISTVSVGLILLGSIVGYYCDWKKSPYVPAWKQQFIDQVPSLLEFTDLIQDQNYDFNTMLFNFEGARNGLKVLYKNKLWIFRDEKPVVFGGTKDGWIADKKSVFIMCPYQSSSIKFYLFRPNNSSPSEISVRTHLHSAKLDAKNQTHEIQFDSEIAIIHFDLHGSPKANPFSNPPDERELVANINHLECRNNI